MNLSQLISAVYTETNRPDLVSETQQAVLESTLYVHTIDFWRKDVCEALVVFDQPLNYLQVLDISSLPLFRKISYIRKTNPIATQMQQTGGQLPYTYAYPPNQFDFLTGVDVGDVLDEYGYERQDIYYEAGDQLNIKSSTQLQYATVGYYAFPNLDASGVNFFSWIARDYPYAIVYKATSAIFGKIGEDKAYAMYMRPPNMRTGDEGGEFHKQMAILRMNSIVGKGW